VAEHDPGEPARQPGHSRQRVGQTGGIGQHP
jgi:hypothetical protein